MIEIVHACRQRRRQRGLAFQRFGSAADGLHEIRAADFQLALCSGQIRLRRCKARLRLGNVRSGQRSRIELSLCRLGLFLQKFDVVLPQVEDRRVAHNVHVSRRCTQKNGLLCRKQLRAPRTNQRFCPADFRDRPSAAQDRLSHCDPACQRVRGNARDCAKARDRDRIEEVLLIGIGAAGRNRRAPSAVGDRHALVRRAQRRLLRRELRIGFVGDAQCLGQCQAGPCRRRRSRQHRHRDGRRDRLSNLRRPVMGGDGRLGQQQRQRRNRGKTVRQFHRKSPASPITWGFQKTNPTTLRKPASRGVPESKSSRLPRRPFSRTNIWARPCMPSRTIATNLPPSAN